MKHALSGERLLVIRQLTKTDFNLEVFIAKRAHLSYDIIIQYSGLFVVKDSEFFGYYMDFCGFLDQIAKAT